MLLSKTDKKNPAVLELCSIFSHAKASRQLSVVLLDLLASFSSVDPPYSFLIFLLGPYGPLKIPWFSFLLTRNSCSVFFNDSLSCRRRSTLPSTWSPALYVCSFSWRPYPISWLKYHLNITYIRDSWIYIFSPDFSPGHQTFISSCPLDISILLSI